MNTGKVKPQTDRQTADVIGCLRSVFDVTSCVCSFDPADFRPAVLPGSAGQ